MSQSLSKISQKKWTKGVVASAQDFAQPQGSHPRSSNYILVRRGGLLTCDGSQIITELNGAVQPTSANIGPITETFLYEPIGLPNSYYALAKDFNTNIPPPASLTAVDGGGGGNLSAGTYSWGVTAVDGAGGETTDTVSIAVVLAANHKGNLSWPAVALAASYNIYRSVANGGVLFLVNTTPITTTSFVDNVADANLGTQQPPTVNNTQVTQFYQLTIPSYGAANIIKTFPADLPVIKDGTGGGFGGGQTGPGPGGTPTSGQQPPTVAGGTVNALSIVPQIVQFNNLMILALGNGYPPYSSDGTTPNTIALTNTFVASYPAHAVSTVVTTGDLMQNAGFFYKASQGGTTAAAPPAFNTATGAQTADGTVIWVSQGTVNAVPAPRGAAHAIVYAGSLWIFNTSPTNTSDNFDGPSCLKMSDLNNQTSWNPLNVAFLDRDDGSQGMGLATFTIAEAGIPPTGSLVAFKEFSTFQINGVFGASNFSIQRAQTDLGCVAPRSIQFVPGFGICRMTHLGIGVFDGVRDRLLSEEIRPYIFGGLPDIAPVDWNYIWFSKGSQTANPPMYCCAVPLRNTSFTSPLTFTIAADSVPPFGAPLFPSGTYFVRVQGITSSGAVFTLPGEPSVFIAGFGGAATIDVNLPAQTQFIQWKIVFGHTGAGNEGTYALFPAKTSANFVNINGNTPTFSGGLSTNLGQMNRLLCFDLVLKGWIIIDLPFAISTLKQYRSVGTIPITTMTGFSDGALRRWQAGDATWDAGAVNAGAPDANIRASVRPPNVFGRNASDRVYFRRIFVRGKGNPGTLSVTFTPNGISTQSFSTQNFTTLPMGGNEFAAYADIAVTAVDIYATINIVTSTGFELDSVDWGYVPKPAGALVVAG